MKPIISILLVMISIVILGCGVNTTETITKVQYKNIVTEVNTTTFVHEMSTPQYDMPTNIIIKDIMFIEDKKGVSVTRVENNATIYLLVNSDANATSIINSLLDIKDPWFNFFELDMNITSTTHTEVTTVTSEN